MQHAYLDKKQLYAIGQTLLTLLSRPAFVSARPNLYSFSSINCLYHKLAFLVLN